MRDLKSAPAVKRAAGSQAAAARRVPSALEFDFEGYLKERVKLVEAALVRCVARPQGPAGRLSDSIRYSLLAGGKRLRPILALAACEAVGARLEAALGLACAVEMVHTYSMVHDDLPCMDDDDLRRGLPTNHKVYGEALATLAGDALLTDAFAVLARMTPTDVPVPVVVETVAMLAEAAGSAGMVAGQTIDVLGKGKRFTLEELEYLHRLKTGALFTAAVVGGGRLGGASARQLATLEAYARALGLAFQVVDDLLDVEGSTEQVGKRTHKDRQQGKATYPSILGVERSHELAARLEREAHLVLADFDERAEPLHRLMTFAVERKL